MPDAGPDPDRPDRPDRPERYRLLLEHLPQTAIVVYDHDLRLELVTGPALREAGLAPAQIEGELLEDVVPDGTAQVLADHYRRALSGEHVSLEYRSALDGRAFWLQVVPLWGEHGEVTGGMAVSLDITERTRVQDDLRRSQEQFRQAFDAAPIGMALLGLDGTLQKVNASLCEITGLRTGDLVGLPLAALVDPDDAQRHVARLEALVRGEVETHGTEMRLRHAYGRAVETTLHAVLVRDGSGEPEHLLLQIQDITDRKRFEDELQCLADHDPLTGLLNRRGFQRELERHVADIKRYGPEGALLVLDLDHFKLINDTLGHQAGDELISQVTRLLRRRLRVTDVLARLGGDEFAGLLPRAGARQAAIVADALIAGVREEQVKLSPLRTGRVTASAGVAMLDDSGLTDEEILSRADRAMYDAKQRGRDCYAFHARRDLLLTDLSVTTDRGETR
ncbi:MAG: sensor domain-containing diguanylate cyclase [Solirubrobacteraceae bacterium]